ncbi:MAG: imelysin family protein [Jatrophihabitans sp.]
MPVTRRPHDHAGSMVGRLATLLLLALAATGCGGHRTGPPAGQTARGPAATPVEVSLSHCGAGWQPRTAGHQQLLLHDTDTRPGEVMIADARTGAVFGYLEPLAAGSRAELDVDLAAGSYRIRCAMEDADVVDGPVITLTGRAGDSSPGVQPVTQAELIGPTRQYQRYVSAQLPLLARQLLVLRSDLATGSLVRARADWLTAHLQYERLGAAYGAFGAADSAINGLPDGLPRGVADPGFTGFHRIEYGLWHRQPAGQLVAMTDALRAAVQSLTTSFATTQLEPAEVAIRAHEITENAIEFELTGHTDFGSASNLATVRANLQGTATVLGLLRPLLLLRYQHLDQLDAALARAQLLVATHQQSLSTLSTAQREQVNAALGGLVEQLAPVAEICEPRRTS